jgi:phosphatidylserine/phosphatidylglycerophosphate/cardiolipin synthase-like enzyme
MDGRTNNHKASAMIKPLFAYVLILATVVGCATEPTEITAPQPNIMICDTPIGVPDILAQQAYIHDNQLYLKYRQLSETVYTATTLPDAREDPAIGSSTSLTLQETIDMYNGLPVAQLSATEPGAWQAGAKKSRQLPVASISLWREFRDRILSTATPQQTDSGILIEFLKEEELFFYYDERGLLKSVPAHEKPVDLGIAESYKFSALLSEAASLLGEYISASQGSGPALLFNTGDGSDYGYPFVYANQETGQIVFLHRVPCGTECPDPAGSKLPEAVMHTTTSHVGGVLLQPIGSLTRLFTLVSSKIVDTVTPKPVALLKDQPIPPVTDNDPMDTDQWEQELNELAYSPVSQGSIEYLVDGRAFFSRMIDAINSAEASIDIRLYIFDNDDYALKIADLLKKRSRDVRVRVLIDGLGTIGAASAYSTSMPEAYQPPPRIIEYLENDSEVHVRMVLNPWLAGDHTKTIIIDNRVAFLGGMNIGREYRYDWHDLMMELHGPVVDAIQTDFEKAWRLQSFLGDIRSALYRPGEPKNEARPDDIPIRLLYTRPGDSQILRAQLAAIARANQRIYIENAYFTSDDIIFELAMARRRGVDVRVIIPYQSDSGLIDRSNVKAINAMLDNGIRVYIYPGESHIKGAIYDDWICLGSANFDQLSLRMNKELNIATSSPTAVAEFMNQVLLPDLKKSVELKEPLPEKWSDFLMETIADQL